MATQIEKDGDEELILHRLPLPQLMITAGGIYAAQGIFGGLTFQGLPTVLRANEVDLDLIGFVFLAMLPWALKFLWAPFLERLRITKENQRRSRVIILTGQFIAVALLILIAFLGFASIPYLIGALILLATIAATIDIACDGFIVEQLTKKTRGWGNTAQIGGGYAGFMIGSGLFLWLYATYDWMIASLGMAICVFLFSLAFLFFKEPQPERQKRTHKPSLVNAIVRPEIRFGILIMILYDIGIRVASGLSGPFMIDKGLSLETVGIVSGIGGTVAGLFGAILGGWVVREVGALHTVLTVIILQIIVLLFFYSFALNYSSSQAALMAVVILQSLVMGLGFVAIYSLLMGFISLKQAGVDFTIFQCVDALVAALGGFGAGQIAGLFGYGTTFGVTAAMTALSFVIVLILVRFATNQITSNHSETINEKT